jgi:hypothetical protein
MYVGPMDMSEDCRDVRVHVSDTTGEKQTFLALAFLRAPAIPGVRKSLFFVTFVVRIRL